MISVLTALPFFAALVILMIPEHRVRWMRRLAFLTAFLCLGITLSLVKDFDPALGINWGQRMNWIPTLGVEYNVGLDGVNILLVLLTSFLFLFVLGLSPEKPARPKLWFSLLLIQVSTLLGVFTALNFIHFFIYWEASLVPAFFLIKLYGGTQRHEAAIRFFVTTVLGSIPLLIGFLALYVVTGKFNFVDLTAMAPSLPDKLSCYYPWVFGAILLGVWVKIPLVPFHSWQPLAYAEAPAPVTVLLTGLMSKMGVYGLLRLILPLFPNALERYSTLLTTMAALTVVWGALAAVRQLDLKRLGAYSSLSHVALCALAVFSMGGAPVSEFSTPARQFALQGAIFQMLTHGLLAAGFFAMVELTERRMETRMLQEMGGLRSALPKLWTFFAVIAFGSIGLPFLAAFVSEFLIFRGVVPLSPVAAGFSLVALFATAVYILNVVICGWSGPASKFVRSLPDIDGAEYRLLVPLTLIVLWIGICPGPLLKLTQTAVARLAQTGI